MDIDTDPGSDGSMDSDMPPPEEWAQWKPWPQMEAQSLGIPVPFDGDMDHGNQHGPLTIDSP